MTRSFQSVKVDEVQAALHAAVKPMGFRKQSRTFNRTTDDGLTQVINIQMGPSDPPGTVSIPGLRENLYGWFTVNLGVYVPEVARFHGGGEAKGFVHEHHCCVRTRLGDVSPEQDIWWRNDAATEVIPEVLTRLERDGLPFLERFRSRDALLQEWKDKSEIQGAGGSPPRIVMAIILAERGAKDAARQLLGEQAGETRNPGHPAYVRSLAERLGVPLDATPPETTSSRSS